MLSSLKETLLYTLTIRLKFDFFASICFWICLKPLHLSKFTNNTQLHIDY
jgi:hypothetical protein